MSRELVVIVADKDMKQGISEILNRPRSLSITDIEYDIIVEKNHDAGVLTNAHELIRLYSDYKKALVIMDKEGCGREEDDTNYISKIIKNKIIKTGRSKSDIEVIIIEPEFDVWLWSSSPHICRILGWDGTREQLNDKLKELNFNINNDKPERPKEALDKILRINRIPHSSSLFSAAAKVVSLKRCNEPSFCQFKTILKQWFSN